MTQRSSLMTVRAPSSARMALNIIIQIPEGSHTHACSVAKTLHAAIDSATIMPTARLEAIARFRKRPSEVDGAAPVQQYGSFARDAYGAMVLLTLLFSQCTASKLRCDGGIPCTCCQRRSLDCDISRVNQPDHMDITTSLADLDSTSLGLILTWIL